MAVAAPPAAARRLLPRRRSSKRRLRDDAPAPTQRLHQARSGSDDESDDDAGTTARASDSVTVHYIFPADEDQLPAFHLHVSPEQYLRKVLQARGHGVVALSSAERGFCVSPTPQQVLDYQYKPLSDAVRADSAKELHRMAREGRCLSACNKFGESLAHLACRRGAATALQVVLQHGGSLTRADDLGRLPLHDVCWANETHWDIVRAHLDLDGTLLLTEDKRGWTPLRYIKRNNWQEWAQFLDSVKDHYWPQR